MKSYNVPNYIRYKEDIKQTNKDSMSNDFSKYSRDKLIVKFLPLVDSIAKKFSTASQSCGVLDITDLIQSGSIGLVQAIDRIEWDTIKNSDHQETTLKSFLSKRIKGSIRRSIDINRGSIKIPEHKLNEIRKDSNKDHTLAAMFFNSIFLSIDEQMNDDGEDDLFMVYQIPDQSEFYNIELMNIYLTSLLKKHLDGNEYEVLRLSYGLDCDKHSANDIASKLGIEGASAYVRVSEIKKQAIKKLIENVDSSQVLEFL
jgi:RNA polymerase sigma factor (sigma-70 family)